MTKHSSLLTRLLSPVSKDTFVSNYMMRKPLIIQGEKQRFDGILNLQQFFDLIRTLRHESGVLSLRPHPPDLIRLQKSDGYINLPYVVDAYSKGCSVHVTDFERISRPVKTFQSELEKDIKKMGFAIDHGAGCSVFLTPHHSQALTPHSDPSDLFILQIGGRKRWKFYGEAPFFGAPGVSAPEDFPCTLEVTLNPGDMAYIPRGFVHHAMTDDDFSLAITIGVRLLTWFGVVEKLIPSLENDLTFMTPLTPLEIDNRFLTEEGSKKLFYLLSNLGTLPALQESLYTTPVDLEEKPVVDFSFVNRVNELSMKTLLNVKHPISLIEQAEFVQLQGPHGEMKGPLKMKRVFEWLADQKYHFLVSDIVDMSDAETSVAFAKQLILKGLLSFADEV
ncbi:MAG: cupin domain-containing protein [Acidobacteriota bacterium]|nr:cupin domain-containing protein [Acidobacteriota bacterium]